MKIGELARRAGCTTETIRFYEKAGLLPEPGRTDANYRTYDDSHVDRLCFIRNCRALDMTHDEIRVLLRARDAPATDCGAIDAVVDDHLGHVNARIEGLRQLRAQLTALRERCGGDRPVERCGIMQGLTAMGRTSHPSKLSHVG